MESTEATITRAVENPDGWEYEVLEVNPRLWSRAQEILCLFGDTGWELVAVTVHDGDHFAWLKRYRAEQDRRDPYAWNGKIPPEDARE